MPDTAYANNPSSVLVNANEVGINSNACYNYLTSIFTKFKADIGTNAASATVYNKFANDLIVIENTAKGDYTLKPIEVQYILIASAVARNSAAYWANYQINLANASNVVANTNKKRLDKTGGFSWGNVGKADVAGAIGGMFGGAVAGAMAGGIGAPAGATAGTVRGAIAGSVGVAVYQIFNW